MQTRNRDHANRPSPIVMPALPVTIRDESPVAIAFKPSTATCYDSFRAQDHVRAVRHQERIRATDPTPDNDLICGILIAGFSVIAIVLFLY